MGFDSPLAYTLCCCLRSDKEDVKCSLAAWLAFASTLLQVWLNTQDQKASLFFLHDHCSFVTCLWPLWHIHTALLYWTLSLLLCLPSLLLLYLKSWHYSGLPHPRCFERNVYLGMGSRWEEQGGQWFFCGNRTFCQQRRKMILFLPVSMVTTPEILHSVLASWDYKKWQERKKRGRKEQ